ncbi:MAG: glycosyltransferase family 39 protein [Chloroflexia bacterium]
MPSSVAHPGPARLRRVDPGWVALLLLFLLSLPLVTPRLYAVDSVEYFSYLHSIFFDGDLDLTNEYRYFQQLNPQAGIEGVLEKRDPTTGLPLNVAPVGTALFWSPAYLLTHGGILLARALGSPVEADGLSRPYILAVCYASVLYAFAGLLLSYCLCRRLFSPFASALAVAVVWLATPAFFYSHASPPWSHSVSLFTVALLIFVWHGTRERPTPARLFVLGLLGGLAALVREQDVVFLLIPVVEVLSTWHRSRARLLPTLVGRLALLGTGAFLAFAPQLAVYRILGGRFAPHPTVAGKFTWWSPYFFQVLGDPHYGLLVWCPVLIPALAGLFLLGRRDRLLGLALGLAFLAQVYLTGAYLTWMGPGSFGPRRFIAGTAIFALGLAALIAFLREKGWPAWTLVALGGLFVAWNLGLMAHWILYPEERTSGLLWDRLPRRLLWEIPRQAADFLRRLFLERGSLYQNPGGR